MKTHCKMCSRAVGTTFKQRWNHVVDYHPQIALKGLLPILANPRKFGETLGKLLSGAKGKQYV